MLQRGICIVESYNNIHTASGLIIIEIILFNHLTISHDSSTLVDSLWIDYYQSFKNQPRCSTLVDSTIRVWLRWYRNTYIFHY